MSGEPKQLVRGKQFQKVVQIDWQKTAEGDVEVEHTIQLLPSPKRARRIRRGRMDIFIDEQEDYVAIVEIKATDWDRILPRNRVKNLRAHEGQVWGYVRKFLEGDDRSVCAGVIYPSAPRTPGLKEQVEEYLNDHGLQVVWYYDK